MLDIDQCFAHDSERLYSSAFLPHPYAYSPISIKASHQPAYPPSFSNHSPFNFDPFADEDDVQTSSSSDGHSPAPALERHQSHQSQSYYPHERSKRFDESQRSQKVEFLRQREWMRRVVAWVDTVNSTGSHANQLYYNSNTPSNVFDYDTPYTFYSTGPSTSDSQFLPDQDQAEEPYVIYSTPVPSSPSPSPPPARTPLSYTLSKSPQSHIPSAASSVNVPGKSLPGRKIHSRVPSLDSITEEDE